MVIWILWFKNEGEIKEYEHRGNVPQFSDNAVTFNDKKKNINKKV